MIFATIGNDHHQFPRFTNLVSQILATTDYRIFYQHGHTSIDFQHERLTSSDFISRDKFNTLLVESKVVICHSGAGTLLQCAYLKKIPFVIPRSVSYNEHINEHQLETLNQFVDLNLAREIKLPLDDSFFSVLSRTMTEDTLYTNRAHPTAPYSGNLLTSLQQTINAILD